MSWFDAAGPRGTHPDALAAQVIVIAKEPVPGRVKTRLTPPFTPQDAALLAKAALSDSLAAAAEAPMTRRVLALDGAPGDWLPAGFDVIGQRGGGLDERLAAAFADTHASASAAHGADRDGHPASHAWPAHGRRAGAGLRGGGRGVRPGGRRRVLAAGPAQAGPVTAGGRADVPPGHRQASARQADVGRPAGGDDARADRRGHRSGKPSWSPPRSPAPSSPRRSTS